MGHQLIMMFEIPAIFFPKFVKGEGFDGIRTHDQLLLRIEP